MPQTGSSAPSETSRPEATPARGGELLPTFILGKVEAAFPSLPQMRQPPPRWGPAERQDATGERFLAPTHSEQVGPYNWMFQDPCFPSRKLGGGGQHPGPSRRLPLRPSVLLPALSPKTAASVTTTHSACKSRANAGAWHSASCAGASPRLQPLWHSPSPAHRDILMTLLYEPRWQGTSPPPPSSRGQLSTLSTKSFNCDLP